jgi:hypothetical protein
MNAPRSNFPLVRDSGIGVGVPAVHSVELAVRRALRRPAPALSAALLAVGLGAATLTPRDAAAFPAVFPLVRLLPLAGGDGSEGFVLQGISAGDHLGTRFARAAGDVNGDGVGDLILAAPYADSGGRPIAGEAYVVFGRRLGVEFPAVLPLASLLPGGGGDGTAGFVLQGIDSYDYGGLTVGTAGDFNGDGVDDLIIGAIGGDPGGRDSAGEAYIVFGRSTGFPPVMQLARLLSGDGSAGFVLQGIDPNDGLGRQVSAAGDVNGDGIDDIIMGAARADPGERTDAGESYVVFGTTAGFPGVFSVASLLPDGGGDGSTGFVLEGIDAYDGTGLWATAAGDVNGDGVADLIVGARFGDPAGKPDAGESYVVFGRIAGFPPVFPLALLLPAGGGDGSRGFVLQGIDAYDGSGQAVGSADLTGDGISDLIISAPGADPGGRIDAGETYVVFGRDTKKVGTFPAIFQLASLLPGVGGDGSQGFVLRGIDAYDQVSFSVSGIGDVNADGIDDMLTGSFAVDQGARVDAGAGYVIFGRDESMGGDFPAVLPLRSLLPGAGGDGSAGFVLAGIDAYDNTSRGFEAGDVNGDGIDDLIIAGENADPGGRTDAGEVYVVFGRATDLNIQAGIEQ